MLGSDKCMQHGTLVLIKQKQTVLRCYSVVNCIHAKKLTVLLKHASRLLQQLKIPTYVPFVYCIYHI